MTWHTHAACRPDHRPAYMTPADWTAWWFPPQRPAGRAQVNALRAICDLCPVSTECLNEADEHHRDGFSDAGFRAGLRQEERAEARFGPRARRSSDLTADQLAEIRRLAEAGVGPSEIAQRVGVAYASASRWRSRFLEEVA